MTIHHIQLPTGVDQLHGLRSVLAKSAHVAFVLMVTLGTLAGSGLVLWSLSMLAHSSYGVFFGA
jgi:hypothetical protein